MNKAGKIWGQTASVFKNEFTELNRIEVNQGAYCSKHKHSIKWNGFYVESGVLKIKVWKDYNLVDETILEKGDYMEVAPGEYHQFECLNDAVAFEIYFVRIPENDIQRKTKGGKK